MPAGLTEILSSSLVLGPMTKGGNLPFRRLCVALGARLTMGEMAVSRQLQRGRRPEFALLVRAHDEEMFGVQLAGKSEAELDYATKLAVERGADLVDLNCGCPIHEITRRGLGSAILRKPHKLGRLVATMKAAAGEVPVTAKIRLAWEDSRLMHRQLARAAEEAGADALVVHGRTREGRYRQAADWERIAEVVDEVSIPVVGNGDLLWPHEMAKAREQSGCAGLMAARGALIKPWIFREAQTGAAESPSPEERMAFREQWVTLAREHWGEDEGGLARIRPFLRWHLEWWRRYRPGSEATGWPGMQERDAQREPESALAALLERGDEAALDWWTLRLVDGEEAAGDPPAVPEDAGEGRRSRGEERQPEG